MNAQNNKPRCALVGIDGASFEVLNKLIKEGRLPNIAALIEKGASGHIESSMPVLSPSVWTTIITGRNPGKHGIYDFLRYDLDKRRILFNSATDRKAAPLWMTLGRNGKRVCVGGLIMTFPPDSVNGLMYSGLAADITTRAEDATISRSCPPELDLDIKKDLGAFEAADDIRGESAFAKEMIASIEYRIRLYKYLSSREAFDFRMFYFPETDHVSHRAFRVRNSADGIGNLFGEMYDRIDEFIGALAREKDLDIILVSDHGFRLVNKSVSVNNILERLGYLHYRPLHLAERLSSLAGRVINRLFASFKSDPMRGLRITELLNGIDWSRTRAFYFGTSGGTIFINLKNRSAAGIVDVSEYDRLTAELADRLREIKDDGTGTPIFRNVYVRKQLFTGPCAENAPDICLEFNDGYVIAMRKDDRFRVRRIVYDHVLWTGDHDKQGIFVACGPHFHAGCSIENAKAADVAPTLLYVMGTAIPSDMDGRVITSAIDSALLAGTPPVIDNSDSSGSTDSTGKHAYSDADQMKLEQRLQDLGYL